MTNRITSAESTTRSLKQGEPARLPPATAFLEGLDLAFTSFVLLYLSIGYSSAVEAGLSAKVRQSSWERDAKPQSSQETSSRPAVAPNPIFTQQQQHELIGSLSPPITSTLCGAVSRAVAQHFSSPIIIKTPGNMQHRCGMMTSGTTQLWPRPPVPE